MKHVKLLIIALLFSGTFSFPVDAQVVPDDFSTGIGESYSQYTLQGEMTKEQEDKFLKTLTPELKSKLEEIKKLDKNKYYRLLRNSFPFGSFALSGIGSDTPRVLAGIRETNEEYKKQRLLEVNTELLALKYKSADNTDKQKIKTDLAEQLSQLFDMRESQKQEEVQQLEKRLQDLKESLKVRKQNKEEIVQRRIQELLGSSKYLRW